MAVAAVEIIFGFTAAIIIKRAKVDEDESTRKTRFRRP